MLDENYYIAVAAPSRLESGPLYGILDRLGSQVQFFTDSQDLLQLIQSSPLQLLGIAVPQHLENNRSAAELCTEIRSTPAIQESPVVVLLHQPSREGLQACYSSGADSVLLPPFDLEVIVAQLEALASRVQWYQARVEETLNDKALQHPALQVLNGVEYGLAVFDRHHRPVFGNDAVAALLGLESPYTPTAVRQALETFRPSLEPLIMNYRGSSQVHPLDIERVNGTRLAVDVRINPLTFDSGLQAGWVALVSERDEYLELERFLSQARRAQSLMLVTSASAFQQLMGHSTQLPLQPVAALEQLSGRANAVANFGNALSALLEVLDLSLSTGIAVKVQGETNHLIAVRFNDLFQLLGHLLLETIESTRGQGEVSIHAERLLTDRSLSAHGSLQLTVSSDSHVPVAIIPKRALQRLLHEDRGASGTTPDRKIGYGLVFARETANKYRIPIEYKPGSLGVSKLRLRLPLAAN